jgi:hypothetical protein
MASDGKEVSAGEVENLDKVKEILFGAEKRETERRFAQLEKNIRADLNDTVKQISQRLDALESFVKKEFKTAAEERRSEQRAREAEDEAINKRVTKLDEQSAKDRQDLREQILEQSKTLRTELHDRSKDLTESLKSNVKHLTDDKTSRSDLASLLVDLAMRLSKDVEISKGKK